MAEEPESVERIPMREFGPRKQLKVLAFKMRRRLTFPQNGSINS